MHRMLTAAAVLGCAALTLAGCNRSTSTADSQTPATTASAPTVPAPASKVAAAPIGSGLPVLPTVLEGGTSFELGKLIYLLMPPPKTSVGWDWAVDSPIIWVDDGFVETDTSTYRRGFVRVNVMGKWSTELKQKKNELGWEVRLFTTSPAKFGPQTIDVQPGPDSGSDMCFGTRFDLCWFDPRPSLEAAGIAVKPVCKYGPNDSNSTHIYQLTAPAKAPVLFSWSQSEGSGGDSAGVSLLLNTDQKAACTEPNP